MEIVKESIFELLSVSVIVSSIVMIIIQKFKHFLFISMISILLNRVGLVYLV